MRLRRILTLTAALMANDCPAQEQVQRNDGEFRLAGRVGAFNHYLFSDTSYQLIANTNTGVFDLLRGDSVILHYVPDLDNRVPVYMEHVPWALDTLNGTLLLEQRISPNSFVVGNHSRRVLEIHYPTAAVFHLIKHATGPAYINSGKTITFLRYRKKQKGKYHYDKGTRKYVSE